MCGLSKEDSKSPENSFLLVINGKTHLFAISLTTQVYVNNQQLIKATYEPG
jgi:hypothetical protein